MKYDRKTKSFFLHIGMHKTGSTLLQDIVFPSLGVHVIKQPDWGLIFQDEGYGPLSLQQDVSAWIGQAGAKKLLVSQEWLSGSAEGNPIWSWERAAVRLNEAFPEARVLIVLREQLDYLLSIYAFRVLTRGLEHRDLTNMCKIV